KQPARIQEQPHRPGLDAAGQSRHGHGRDLDAHQQLWRRQPKLLPPPAGELIIKCRQSVRPAGLAGARFFSSNCNLALTLFRQSRALAFPNLMNNRHDKILFWGCFIALITTSYAFISRMILCGGQFVTDFGLDKVSVGELQGAGMWPFGVSIIIFSLFIDRIGYKVAMFFSFVSYFIYTAMAFAAYSSIQGLSGDALVAGQKHGYQLLYWGSIILGLGNGSAEAYCNPIVATMFSTDKAKWLNRLHAGWPGGLVLGGLCTIYIAKEQITDWRLKLGLILIPAFIFFFIF